MSDQENKSSNKLLSLIETVSENLRQLGNVNIKQENVRLADGRVFSYFRKPLVLTTEENRKTRKALREFEAAVGNLFPGKSTSPAVVEWGPPDSMKLIFNRFEGEKTNYIHVKSIAPRDGSSLESKKKLYVTGSCLFGKHGVSGQTTSGKTLNLCDVYQMRTATAAEYGKVVALDVMPTLHSYEVMSPLARYSILTETDADTVYFNAPFSPYVLYAREAMRQGLVDKGVFSEWVSMLTERVADVIAYEQDVAGHKVVAVDPLIKYMDLLVDTDLSLEDMVKAIASDDPWWDAYFKINDPQAFADIGNGSYMRVYYDLMNSGENIEVVAVEDQTEMRILLELQSYLKQGLLPEPSASSGVVGLYPLVPIVLPDENGHANAAFISDEFGRKDLSADIFAAAAASVPDDVLSRARKSLDAIRVKQAQRNDPDTARPPVDLKLQAKISQAPL